MESPGTALHGRGCRSLQEHSRTQATCSSVTRSQRKKAVRDTSHKPKPHKLENIKAQLVVKYGLCCYYCGWILTPSEVTLDHVVPRSTGGEWIASNLVLACECCNIQKANLPIELFRVYRWLTRGKRTSIRRRTVELIACHIGRRFADVRFAGEGRSLRL